MGDRENIRQVSRLREYIRKVWEIVRNSGSDGRLCGYQTGMGDYVDIRQAWKSVWISCRYGR